MFAQQIQGIESQIQELNAKLTQYRSLEGEVETALAAIARIKESAQALGVENEVSQQIVEAVGVNQSVTQEVDVQPVVEAEQQVTQEVDVQPVVEEPPTEPPTEREELRQEHHDQVASEVQMSPEPLPQDHGQLDIFAAIESAKETTVDNRQLDSVIDSTSTEENAEEQWVNLVEDEPENGYETAEQISEALADTENLDTHLMAIASILDECNAQEVAGRVWFFVQNVPGEFDSRILGYLPKSIRPEWDKQRTTQFVEARESILPPTSKTLVVGVSDLVETPTGLVGHITDVVYNAKEGGRIATVALPNNSAGEFDVHSLRYVGKYQAPAPEFKVGDWVELYTGEVCKVSQVKDFDGKIYVEVVNGEGKKEAYRNSDLKPALAPVEVKGEVAAPVAAATTKKSRKPKAKAGSVESAPQPVEQTIETIEPDDLVQLPRGEVVPVLNVTYLGGSAQVSVKLPNGMEASFPASQLKKMPGVA